MAKKTSPLRGHRSRQAAKSDNSSKASPTANRRSASKTTPDSEKVAQPADQQLVRKRSRRTTSTTSIAPKNGPARIGADQTGEKPANPATRQGVKGFLPGISGNPAGRPPGSKNKTTLFAELLEEGEREEIFRKLADNAKAGDPTAMRMAIDRLDPKPRSRAIEIELPPASTREGIIAALEAVTQAVAKGEITPDEGHSFVALLLRTSQAIAERGILERVEQAENNIGRLELCLLR